MKLSTSRWFVLATVAVTATIGESGTDALAAPPTPASPTPAQIVARATESSAWGLGGAEVSAKALVTDKAGKTRALVFDAKSRQDGAQLGKSVITFQAPADVAGMKFLQIQSAVADDERFLYTPDLKRSRRIAATNRADSFMGTDFSYADLDGKDLRQSSAVLKGEEVVGKFDTYHLSVTPQNADAVYAKIELWVRKDNYVPLKTVMFDKRSNPVKTLLVKELQRHAGRWFVTGSRMTDNATGRSTELVLDKVERRDDIPVETFSLRAIERG
jgi:hypothetical protein